MNVDQLSRRLQTVASYISHGMRIADIGSDHAYLPCHAVKKGIASYAIAGEIADGPFESARKQVKKSGLENAVDVRKGDGLQVLKAGEADCMIIAGMGGLLISRILAEGKDKLDGMTRLILQPNVGSVHVRKWLYRNGWELVAEEILEDDGKMYEILVAEPGDPAKPYHDLEKELLLGPFLMKEKSREFRKKWAEELARWEKIVRDLDQSPPRPETAAKKEEILQKISIVKEALA
jgi:tRNA (adenine22-N1)-methyltransferase